MEAISGKQNSTKYKGHIKIMTELFKKAKRTPWDQFGVKWRIM